MDDGGGWRLARGSRRCARLTACWLSASACGPSDRPRLAAVHCGPGTLVILSESSERRTYYH